ncbi:MAG: putative alpha/beta superfamily hydrolase [Flavobacteriales bacterium]|jgi:predicted alpha/beta superfamily hydrolase
MKIQHFLTQLIIVTFTSHLLAQSDIQSSQITPLIIGQKIEFHSEILDENRILNIYLPNGYHKDSSTTYPVIYLLDGSIDEDFLHISGIVQFGSFSWINMIPESIVVGISNIDRKKDFTFPSSVKQDQIDFPTTGSSEQFIQFIADELQPLVDNKFNTTSEKTIIGQSLGGLLATEILFKNPDLFNNYIIVSPSLWWDAESLLDATPVEYTKPKSIYIAVGKEGPIMQRTAKQLFKKIKKGNQTNSKINFKYYKAQNHGDVLHLATYDAFKVIFAAEK